MHGRAATYEALKKEMDAFDQKWENQVHTHERDRTTSHICDEAYILLEKLQVLGVRAVLFLSTPAKKPNASASEVLTPRCQLTDTSRKCLETMKDLYDDVIKGWTPLDAAGKLDECSSAPVDAPARPPVEPLDHLVAEDPSDPPTALTSPPPSPTVILAFSTKPCADRAVPEQESEKLAKRPHSPKLPPEVSRGSPEKGPRSEAGGVGAMPILWKEEFIGGRRTLVNEKDVEPGQVTNMVAPLAKLKQRTVGVGVRNTLYKAAQGVLPHPNILKVAEVYKHFPADVAPLITTMSISDDVPLVSSVFGDVQKGSPISYQHPVPVSPVILMHSDPPPRPSLPLDNYRLAPTSCQYLSNTQEQLHLRSLSIDLHTARKIEAATREQSACVEWHRRHRVTASHFREVCHVQGTMSAERLAERMNKSVAQSSLTKQDFALERAAIQDYCRIKNASYWPCGFIIHPDAPWFGASPVGVVFDPTENPAFGLLEIKYPKVKSFVDCGYLRLEGGSMTLKKLDSYFWQTQGQLLVSGMHWCDFVVCAEDDMVIQRIYRDDDIAKTIRERGDHFFFYIYMSVCLRDKQ